MSNLELTLIADHGFSSLYTESPFQYADFSDPARGNAFKLYKTNANMEIIML